MPKKTGRDKRIRLPMRSRTSPAPHKADSVKELLARAAPALRRVTEQAARQSFWSEWLAVHLPAGLHKHVSGVAERDGTLVIFAASAAFSARLHYAVLELEAQMRSAAPGLAAVKVRVLPLNRG
jgi:hypothetical protein